MSRDATVTRMIVVEYAGRDAGYGIATARSRNWSESSCIVEVMKVLRCLGRSVACRVACRVNGVGSLSPTDNMLSDHAHTWLRETKEDEQSATYHITKPDTTTTWTARTLTDGDTGPLSDRK